MSKCKLSKSTNFMYSAGIFSVKKNIQLLRNVTPSIDLASPTSVSEFPEVESVIEKLEGQFKSIENYKAVHKLDDLDEEVSTVIASLSEEARLSFEDKYNELVRNHDVTKEDLEELLDDVKIYKATATAITLLHEAQPSVAKYVSNPLVKNDINAQLNSVIHSSSQEKGPYLKEYQKLSKSFNETSKSGDKLEARQALVKGLKEIESCKALDKSLVKFVESAITAHPEREEFQNLNPKCKEIKTKYLELSVEQKMKLLESNLLEKENTSTDDLIKALNDIVPTAEVVAVDIPVEPTAQAVAVESGVEVEAVAVDPAVEDVVAQKVCQLSILAQQMNHDGRNSACIEDNLKLQLEREAKSPRSVGDIDKPLPVEAEPEPRSSFASGKS